MLPPTKIFIIPPETPCVYSYLFAVVHTANY